MEEHITEWKKKKKSQSVFSEFLLCHGGNCVNVTSDCLKWSWKGKVFPWKPVGFPSGAQIHLHPIGESSPGGGWGCLKTILLCLNEGIVTSEGKRNPFWDAFKNFFGARRKTQQNSQTKSNKRPSIWYNSSIK